MCVHSLLRSKQIHFYRTLLYCVHALPNTVQFVCEDSNDECSYRTFDGTLASSLNIFCGEDACWGTTIICPAAQSANCTIQCAGESACQGATFESAGGAEMNTFSLSCYDGSSSCHSATMALDPNSIAFIDITCSSHVCQLVHVRALIITKNIPFFQCSIDGVRGYGYRNSIGFIAFTRASM